MIMLPSPSPAAETGLSEAEYLLLYRQTLPVVTRHVCRNSGNEAEAQDVFQDAVLILVRNQRRPDFRLEVEPGAYVHAVAGRLWLKRLRARRVRAEKQTLVQVHLEQIAPGTEEPPLPPSSLKKWIESTTPHCQRLLNALYIAVEPIESLMRRMGWKNLRTARNLKYKCLEQMRRHTPNLKKESRAD